MIRDSHLLVPAGVVLAAAVLLAPLPWGSALPADRFWLSIVLLVAALPVLASATWREMPLRVAFPGGMLLAIAGVGFLQALPLPSWLVGLVAGRSAEVWRESRSLAGASEGGAMTVSLAPDQTLDSAAWIGVLGMTFLVAAVVGRNTVRRRILGAALVVAGCLQIVLPSAPSLAGTSRLFAGLGPSPNLGTHWFRGSYANPNHLSLLFGVLLLVVAAGAWWGARRVLRGDSLTRRALALAVPLVLLLSFAAALARIGSRAGLLAVAGGLVVLGGLVAAHYGRRRMLAVGSVLGAVGAVFGAVWLLFFGGRDGLNDLLQTSVYDLTVLSRARVAAESLGLWLEMPLTGIGLGAYRQVFPLAQSSQLQGGWDHVHNDWIEARFLVTGGPLAVAALLAGLWILARHLWIVVQRGRRSEDRAAGFAALGALVVAGIHELFDFGLLVPANALALVVVCGAAAGAPLAFGPARRGRRRRGSSSTPRLEVEGAPAEVPMEIPVEGDALGRGEASRESGG